jgi:hypothetical protein
MTEGASRFLPWERSPGMAFLKEDLFIAHIDKGDKDEQAGEENILRPSLADVFLQLLSDS